jgi:hypothetical protein
MYGIPVYRNCSPAMTAGAPVTPGKGVSITASAAGLVNLTLAGGSVLQVYAPLGTTVFNGMAVKSFSLPNSGQATITAVQVLYEE